jgi:hypothetical protein
MSRGLASRPTTTIPTSLWLRSEGSILWTSPYLALMSAIAGGAEAVLVPEFEPDPEDLIGFLMASCWYDDECPASVEGDEK